VAGRQAVGVLPAEAGGVELEGAPEVCLCRLCPAELEIGLAQGSAQRGLYRRAVGQPGEELVGAIEDLYDLDLAGRPLGGEVAHGVGRAEDLVEHRDHRSGGFGLLPRLVTGRHRLPALVAGDDRHPAGSDDAEQQRRDQGEAHRHPHAVAAHELAEPVAEVRRSGNHRLVPEVAGDVGGELGGGRVAPVAVDLEGAHGDPVEVALELSSQCALVGTP